MAADLVSVAGVVTIDLNANPSTFYRLTTTENVDSWVISGDVDGDGFLPAIAVSTGDTVTFTGLVDTWTNGGPSLGAGDTIYFSMVRDGTTWIGESSNIATTDLANVLQTVSHTVAGAAIIDGNNGHNVEITLTNDITGHTINNLNDGERLTVSYIASGADRDVDFTAATEFSTFTNPENVTITSAH